MHSGERWRLGHRPALDGLRGMAIGLVLFAHFTHGKLENFGSVGVTVFFALSGFLITALLLDERGQRGRISLARFYGRRARRLLPALAVYLAFWVTLGALGIGPFQYAFNQVLAVVFYASNWVMAAHHTMPGALSITWSLSVEEQFYLLWPLAILAGRRWRWIPIALATAGTVYAVAVRILVWGLPMGPSMYYRTDTRMDSLLIGCLLALALKQLGGVPSSAGRLLWPGLGVLVFVLAWPSDWGHYVAEPALAAVASVCVIVALLERSGSLFASEPLRWLGRRSYALYLWHYPIVSLAWAGTMPTWLALVLSFAAAEASWWLVERPFQRLGRGRVRRDARAGKRSAVVGELVGDSAGVRGGRAG